MPGYRRAYRGAKRLVPLVLAAKRHWDNLEEHEKELYKERARKYAAVASAYAREAASRTGFPRNAGSSSPKRSSGGTSRTKRSSGGTSRTKRSSTGTKRSSGTNARKGAGKKR